MLAMSSDSQVGRKVTVGVCGGVAAYRAVELVRALQQEGFDPHVVMTAAAKEFVTALTFAAVSGHRVIDSLWTGGEVPEGASSVEHIEEAQTTRALVIVPATANVLGKLAHGIADDFLTTMYLATPAPVVIAPAMNVVMWEHTAVQANVAILRARGHAIVEPGAGHLACGMQGSGRLADLPEIVAAVSQVLETRAARRDLAWETVLVTAGGTREAIDGVRFLGNRSSGRMGYALAEEAMARGAKVILVTAATGIEAPSGAEVVRVTSAAEMRAAVLDALPRATMVLKAAAVSDFRPVRQAEGKLERGGGGLTLELEATEDIVAEVVRRMSAGTLVVAFAAEIPGDDGDAAARGRAKMLRKGVDAMVVNDVSVDGLGFDSDRNAGTMLVGERRVELPASSKREMARRILDEAVALRSALPDGPAARRAGVPTPF
jgi:phosphopantothenoylcysteine decarboxylase/phosphopantothenate--cysteine ligase